MRARPYARLDDVIARVVTRQRYEISDLRSQECDPGTTKRALRTYLIFVTRTFHLYQVLSKETN